MDAGVSGVISIVEEEDDGTLDEPVLTTLKRDIAAVGRKIVNVLLPRKNKSLLQDWDLWGPLILCILMSIFFHYGSTDSSGEGGIPFVGSFFIFWIGAGIVTINIQLLEGKVSFFQCVCTLGYCSSPLAIALLVAKAIISVVGIQAPLKILIKLLLCSSSLGWSMWAVLGFLNEYLPRNRKELAVYPIFLFYSVITGFILTSN